MIRSNKQSSILLILGLVCSLFAGNAATAESKGTWQSSHDYLKRLIETGSESLVGQSEWLTAQATCNGQVCDAESEVCCYVDGRMQCIAKQEGMSCPAN